MDITKTWLRKNLKTGSNPYGCGFTLRINGEIKADYRGRGLKKDDIVDRIYTIARDDGMNFDEIILHTPSATGAHDSGNTVAVPEKFLDRPADLAAFQETVARTLADTLSTNGAGDSVELRPATSFGYPWVVDSEPTGPIDVRRKQNEDQPDSVLIDGLQDGQRVLTVEDEPDTVRSVLEDFVNESLSGSNATPPASPSP